MCCRKSVKEMVTESLRAPIFALSVKDSVPYSSQATTPPPANPNPSTKISPAVLFIIVILAIIFFISGLLHLLVRFLIRKSPSSASSSPSGRWQASAAELSGPDVLQRQLQQLFHLHDSGLDQAFIDALPVFLYKEIVGTKEPFDCAVCLCEFAEDDKLRLLPLCGHAFHLNCIDTWLLSNSTCPLCRGMLFTQGLTLDNPMFDFEDFVNDGRLSGEREGEGDDIVMEKRLFPVRLGKFKNLGGQIGGGALGYAEDGRVSVGDVRCEQGESSSSNLDARRCFSLGSYQYVVAEANLQVALDRSSIRNTDNKGGRNRTAIGLPSSTEVMNGKRLGIGSKAESLSVSKIWQWSNKKGKFPAAVDDTSPDGNFQWVRNNGGNR